MADCQKFIGRRKAICEGRSGLPRAKENAYRALWGLPPLPEEPSAAGPPLKTRTVTVSTRGEPLAAKPPSLFAQMKSFMKSLVKHAANGGRRRTDAEIRKLVAICEACPFYDAARARCVRCGCNCSGKNEFFNKLAWRSESCPDGRW